jgi:hypothetical protein
MLGQYMDRKLNLKSLGGIEISRNKHKENYSSVFHHTAEHFTLGKFLNCHPGPIFVSII